MLSVRAAAKPAAGIACVFRPTKVVPTGGLRHSYQPMSHIPTPHHPTAVGDSSTSWAAQSRTLPPFPPLPLPLAPSTLPSASFHSRHGRSPHPGVGGVGAGSSHRRCGHVHPSVRPHRPRGGGPPGPHRSPGRGGGARGGGAGGGAGGGGSSGFPLRQTRGAVPHCHRTWLVLQAGNVSQEDGQKGARRCRQVRQQDAQGRGEGF